MADDPKKVDLKGRVVVFDEGVMAAGYRDLERRKAKVTGGFGAVPFTRGSALMVEMLCTGEKGRMERFDVDWDATQALWEANEQDADIANRFTDGDLV